MAFTGFPKDTLTFLADLAKHNERKWFEAHRADYEDHYLGPASDFVEAAGAQLHKMDRDIHFEPRVNGSIMRINRDIRFSKDKRPYKDHLDLWFWHGSDRKGPGYWFRLTPRTLGLGAGMHGFPPALMDRYRNAVADPTRGAALVRAVQTVRKAGYEVGGAAYKRVPPGYEASGERAELLKHGGLHVGVEQPVPPETHDARFTAFCVAHWRRMAPVMNWIAQLVADG